MARTVEVIIADIERIKTAISTGALTVSAPDRTVTYRSLTEMWKVLAALEEELAALQGTKRVKAIRFKTSPGYQ